MAELRFYTGPMSSGKSTLALQTAHNIEQSGLNVALLTMNDRGGNQITSRLGISRDAIVISPDDSIIKLYIDSPERWNVIICDEAQFYSSKQVEQLAYIADMGTDVYAYGLKVSFQSKLFPGTARFMELADKIYDLQVETRCWCGKRATQNARVVHGKMVKEGDTVVVGDTDGAEVSYVLLCRYHFMENEHESQLH